MNHDAHQKVKPSHLKRNAYLYVRQSTLRQVLENTESTQRQYALRQQAVALGWPLDRVIVIDTDLGQSGASAVDREGFQRLVTEVSLARAGIVLGLEVSRLARNSMDWHRLLEICALTDTLILDEDGVYDPAHFNDRLLLGLKGTMSEAELHVLRARLQGGIRNKARRLRRYLRYPLSYRGLEEVMTERGLSVDHSTLARRVLHYGPILNQRIRRQMRQPNRSWRVDETYVRVAGRWAHILEHRSYETDFLLDCQLE